ncbi:MAG: hypothetical protein WEF50_07350 [Myxococcota bacterium]
MERGITPGPEETKLSKRPSLYKPGGLAVWNSLDVRISGEKFPSTPVGDLHSAAAKEGRSALFAIQKFEHPMRLTGVAAQNPRVHEQLARRAPIACLI